MWIKVWKIYYGEGPGLPDYLEYDTEDQIEKLVLYWEEEDPWDQMHHSVGWELIEKPPKEWLKTELKKYISYLFGLTEEYRQTKSNLERTIKKYYHLLGIGSHEI